MSDPITGYRRGYITCVGCGKRCGDPDDPPRGNWWEEKFFITPNGFACAKCADKFRSEADARPFQKGDIVRLKAKPYIGGRVLEDQTGPTVSCHWFEYKELTETPSENLELLECAKPRGRPRTTDPLLIFQARFPQAQIDWLKANGGAEKLRELVARAME